MTVSKCSTMRKCSDSKKKKKEERNRQCKWLLLVAGLKVLS